MSTSRARIRSLRPQTEDLETRQLLSATFRGTDIDGDTYTLRLSGPGDLRVDLVDTKGAAVTNASTPALIGKITIAGADPTTTRLIGRVTKSATGDGKVFFQNMTELGGRAEGPAANLGLLAIDMPNFFLGATKATAGTNDPMAITIPDGVVTLRFGGVDTDFTIPGGTPLNQNGQSDAFNINLGLPRTQGTSIIVDMIRTDAQAATTSGGTPTQDSVTINVLGRINQFQANNILGNTTVTPLPNGFQSSSFSSGGGGTVLVSSPDTVDAINGAIGFVRVGGNATNFSAQTNDKITNFYVGGETNNVFLLAPGGSRHLFFGKGMDTVTVRTHEIDTLQANRGALNSTVISDRIIDTAMFGGDVVNTRVLAGFNQGLASLFSSQTAPTNPPTLQDGGAIGRVSVAGDVTNSIFAASVSPSTDNPLTGAYGTGNDLVVPHGHITAKVEGRIDNNAATSAQPQQAFFAHDVELTGGPVAPPDVPELPFPNPGVPPHGPRVVKGLQPALPAQMATATTTAAARAAARAQAVANARAAAARTGQSVPRPSAVKKKSGY